MTDRDRLYLEHILDATFRIQQFVEGIDKEDFESNRLIQDAVIRNFLGHR